MPEVEMSVRQKAEAAADADLAACAAAVILWRRTGRLEQGSALHKIAEIWETEPQFLDDGLRQAEMTVVKLALQRVAEPCSR
ncbi:hypothetical protein [Comamonas thiooxydans]|uniref:hypothetical protein n=1 Tax=Comamonas thiooxydans TaxID=363952 RepID=UPI000B419576|nr:hypothetical protein [Comamonas thiooxydans]